MSDKITRVEFPANWFNQDRITAIFRSKDLTAHPHGGEHRLSLIERLVEEIGEDGCIDHKIGLPATWLRSWAFGCLGAWTSSDRPLTDHGRAMLRASAKALKCWETLLKLLPVVDEAGFEADADDAFDADEEEAAQ